MAEGEEAATAYTIGWEPQLGPQTALLACPVFEVFFGGARGGGKTDGMLGEWASHADLHGKNAVGLMVRRERVQLLETIERSRQIYGPVGAMDRLLPRGALVRYREWYGAAAPNVGLKMTAEAVGAGIVERELNDPTLRYGVLDPACFKEDGGPSLAERINKVLIQARLRPFHAADNSRVPQRGSNNSCASA